MSPPYGYDPGTGELLSVSYNDSTPGLAYTYNRLGKLVTVTDGIGARSFVYNLTGGFELQNEVLGTASTAYYGDRRLSYGYDTATGVVGRYNRLGVGTASNDYVNYDSSIGYDLLGRLNHAFYFDYITDMLHQIANTVAKGGLAAASAVLLLTSCVSAREKGASSMNPLSMHYVSISAIPVAYSVPGELVAGYGKVNTRIDFPNPPDVKTTVPFGNAAQEKRIGTFYYGVTGDFQDFEMTVNLWAIKFDSPMATNVQLADYVRAALPKGYMLKNGKEFVASVSVSKARIGERDVVTAVTDDMNPARTVQLRNDSWIMLLPRQSYFVSIAPTLGLVIQVEHYTKRSPDAQRITFGDKLAHQIIESLHFRN